MLDKVSGDQRTFQAASKRPHLQDVNDKSFPEQKIIPSIPEEMREVKQPAKEELEMLVHGMNDFLKPSNTHLKFEFHDQLKEYYIAVVDNVTQEVVKEIPPKKLLDIYAAMTDYLGLLVDKKI